MSITEQTDGIWTIDHPLRVRGLIPLGTRTTIVRLLDQSLLVHSPGPLSDEHHDQIAALGTVSVIVSPNLEHVLFLSDAASRYPNAQLWVAPGCPTALPRDARTLDDTADAPWKGALVDFQMAGMPRLRETVFLHEASGTLIVTDISFNIRRAGFWDRMMLSMAGAYGKFGPSHLFRSYFLQDRAAFKESLDAVLAHDFERVILAHGDVVRDGGRDGLRAAFAFLG